MNTSKILGLGFFGAILVAGLVVVFSYFSYNNQEVALRQQAEAQRVVIESDYGEYPKYGYVNLTMFFSWFNKLGITYDIPYQPEMFWVEEGKELSRKDAFFYDMLDDELWEVIFDGKEETFCNFLFGNGSQLDGFETDCIPWDKYDEFEKDLYGKLDNHGKCQIFSHYNG